jgi:hypothetical protein
VIFLLAVPNLSQDFYRFIWDGHLVLMGENPYLYTPSELFDKTGTLIPLADYLLEGMGKLSASHFSNYPPVSQLFYGLSVWLGGGEVIGSLISMRMVIVLADVGIFYYGRKLLKLVNQSPHLIFWYFLNPLVIIELGGNVHFEGVMLFFFLFATYQVCTKKWLSASFFMALSISVKLIPMMFLPLFFKALGIRKGLLFQILVLVGVIVTALPFYHPLLSENYMATLSLWFSNFEFNASIYNAVKHLGGRLDLKPWELIRTYGKIFPWLVVLWVGILTFFRANRSPQVLLQSMLLILTLYFFLSPTVHPWYVISLVLLCLFTEFRYPILWSATLVFSYSAYRADPAVTESMGFLIIEYLSVYGFLVYELFKQRGLNSLIPKK